MDFQIIESNSETKTEKSETIEEYDKFEAEDKFY